MFTHNLHTPIWYLGRQLLNDPFAVCGRRCPVYVYHIGPLAVEDRSLYNLPWTLTVRTRKCGEVGTLPLQFYFTSTRDTCKRRDEVIAVND